MGTYELDGLLLHKFQAVEAAGHRVTESEKETVITACNEQLKWLEQNPDASTGELESHLKAAQTKCQSTMMKLVSAGGTGMGPPGAMAGPPGGIGGPFGGTGGPPGGMGGYTGSRRSSGGPRVTEL